MTCGADIDACDARTVKPPRTWRWHRRVDGRDDRPQPTGLAQLPGLASVGLIRRERVAYIGEVRVGDDDLVPQPFQTSRYPLALRGRLEEDAGPGR